MLLMYLLTAAVATVWACVLLRHSGLLGGCLALVLLACCFGFDFYSVRGGPIPLTSDRLAFVFLAAVFILGRIHGWIRSGPIDRVDLLFGSFLLMLLLNTLTHDWQFRGAQPVSNLLFLYFLPAGVYWIARGSDLGEHRLRMAHLFFGIFGIYLAITAMAEVKQLDALVFPRYILTSESREWLGRGRGPFLNPATNGMYMSTGLFALALMWTRVGRLGKGLLLAPLGLLSIGIYCTLTRSCWIGAGAGLGIILLATMSRSLRLPFLVGCVVLGTGFIALTGSSLSSFKRDKNVSEYHMAQSAQLRPMLAVVAMRIFHDYPLFGCGFGQYKKVDGNYAFDPNADTLLSPAKRYVQHNVFLSLLAETGGVGLALFLALIGGWLHRAWRVWRNEQLDVVLRHHGLLLIAFFSCCLINGMFHDTNLMINANLLAYLLAGMSQGILAASKVAPNISHTDATVMSGHHGMLAKASLM